MNRVSRALLLGVFAGSVFLLGPVAQANSQAWPTRSIKLIVPTGPGLLVDVVARMVADAVSRQLGQQVFVENIPGAAGRIAMQAGARAAPDGYTFLFSTSGIISSQYLYNSVPYDAFRDFTPVAMVSNTLPFALTAPPDLPIKNVSDLIAYAKSKPGTLSYGVDSSSSMAVLIGQSLSDRAGIDWVKVPYKSTPQMAHDTSAGAIQIMISSIAAVQSQVASGRLNMIAVSSAKRFPGFDNVQAIAETLPHFQFDGWLAVVAPAGTPALVVERLNREIDVFLKDPTTPARMQQMGAATNGAGTPESMRELFVSDAARWKRLVVELNIQKQ